MQAVIETRFVHAPSCRAAWFAVATFALGITVSAGTLERAEAQSAPSPVKGTRVTPGEAKRVFVMAGFEPDACAFIGFPEMGLQTAPSKGQVSFKQGEATTIQYSLSGKCI